MLLLAVFGVYRMNEIMLTLTLVRGRGSVRFWRYEDLYEVNRVRHARARYRGLPLQSYHKKHEYVWFREGDL